MFGALVTLILTSGLLVASGQPHPAESGWSQALSIPSTLYGGSSVTCRTYVLANGCPIGTVPLVPAQDISCLVSDCPQLCCGADGGRIFTVSNQPAPVTSTAPVALCTTFVQANGCGFGMQPRAEYENLSCADDASCRETCCLTATVACSGFPNIECPSSTIFMPQAGCPKGAVDCRPTCCMPYTTCAYVQCPPGSHSSGSDRQCALNACQSYCCVPDYTCRAFGNAIGCGEGHALAGASSATCGDGASCFHQCCL